MLNWVRNNSAVIVKPGAPIHDWFNLRHESTWIRQVRTSLSFHEPTRAKVIELEKYLAMRRLDTSDSIPGAQIEDPKIGIGAQGSIQHPSLDTKLVPTGPRSGFKRSFYTMSTSVSSLESPSAYKKARTNPLLEPSRNHDAFTSIGSKPIPTGPAIPTLSRSASENSRKFSHDGSIYSPRPAEVEISPKSLESQYGEADPITAPDELIHVPSSNEQVCYPINKKKAIH